MKKHKTSIILKFTVLLCLTAVIFLGISTILAYVLEFESLRKATVDSHREMARLMAASVSELISKEASFIKMKASDEALLSAVRESNGKYQGMDASAAKRYLMDIDKRFLEAGDDHPLKKDYLANRTSASLQSLVKDEKGIVKILVTDKFGGLVAASGKVPSFYQADKDWWQKAFDEGKGKTYIGDLVFDDASGVWCLPFIIPVRNDGGETTGIYNAMVDINIFFKPLENFRLGKTGEAALVDDKSYLIYHRAAKPFTNKFSSYDDLQKVLRNQNKWIQIDGVYRHSGKVVVGFSEVASPVLLNKAAGWWVFVVQDAKEVLKPLIDLMLYMIIMGAVLLIALAVTGFILGSIFVKPITKLRDGMTSLGMGDLDHKVALETSDEIGELADYFNRMTEGIRKTTTSITTLNKEIKSEVEKKEEALKKMDRLEAGLVSAISQLSGPISILKQSVGAILEEKAIQLNERQKSDFFTARTNIDRLTKGIDSLIDIARIESGKLALKMETLDIKTLLKKIIFIFEPKVRAKGLDLKLDIPKAAISVSVDVARITQVFENLIDNAIKFTERGYIEIAVKELKNEVECSVIDTGVGISSEDIPKVFNGFQNIGRALEPQGLSAGLGLSIARWIVEMHKGKIWVESSPGKLTKFTFKLPKQKSS